MTTETPAIERAVRHLGSQQKLAEAIGRSQGLIWQMVHGQTTITAECAKAIEEATGGAVQRHELRPDIFDRPAAGPADQVQGVA